MLNSKKLIELKQDLEFKTDTYRNLGKKYGVHEVTIRRYNVMWGFGRKPIDYKGLEEDLKSGEYKREYLAEKYGVAVKTVYNIKKRLGLVNARNR